MTSAQVSDAAVRVIVCGNADRGDDGAAPIAVAALLPSLPAGLRLALDIRRSTELRVEDLVDLGPDAVCLIVDAVAGVEPGRIVRLPLGELGDRPGFTPRSSHQLPIHLVVGLAGILRDCPVEGSFIGLGGDAFGYGAPLSPVARAAIPGFGEAIAHELADLVPGAPRRPAAPAAEAV